MDSPDDTGSQLPSVRRPRRLKYQITAKPSFAPSEPHSQGFLPLRRLPAQEATNTGFTSPGYATSSGFLNLLTSYSACATSALSHAESVHGVETLRGFPLPVAATAFTAHCPSSSSSTLGSKPQRRSEERRPDTAPRHGTTPLRRAERFRPSIEWTSSRIHAPGRSVLSKAVLSDIRWPCLSQPFVPFEGLSPRASASLCAGPPLMGFLVAMN
jgi:hypothetical protein